MADRRFRLFEREFNSYLDNLPTFVKSIELGHLNMGQSENEEEKQQPQDKKDEYVSRRDDKIKSNSKTTVIISMSGKKTAIGSSSSSEESDESLGGGLFGGDSSSSSSSDDESQDDSKKDVSAAAARRRQDEIENSSFLIFKLQFCRPFDEVIVHFEDDFKESYPKGTVTFSIRDSSNASILRCLPGSAGPTFQRIAKSIENLARAAKADEQAYVCKTGIQDDNNNNKTATSNSSLPLNPLENIYHNINSTSSSAKKSSATAFSVGPSIEELFPIPNNNNNNNNNNTDDDDDQQYHYHIDATTTMMGRPSMSASTSMMMGRPSMTNNVGWSAAPTFERDVALDALAQNEKLIKDIRRIEFMLDGGQHMGKNQISASVSSTARSVDAGLISFSFSFSCVELCEDIMRKFVAGNVYKKPTNKIAASFVPKSFLYESFVSVKVRTMFALLDSLSMERSERFIFKFTVDPILYPLGAVKVDFGQSGNFLKGSFPGAVGQLRRILSSFILNEQRIAGGDVSAEIANSMRSGGFSEEELTSAINNNGGDFLKGIQQLEKEYSLSEIGKKGTSTNNNNNNNNNTDDKEELSDVQKLNFRKQHPPAAEGIFVGCVIMMAQRIHSLPSECCICARPHVFVVSGTSQMCGISVCTRSACQFRFSKLDVATDVASSSALQTGVIDLIVVLCRAAALSERWKLVFDPTPTLIDPKTGKVRCDSENPDIELCREILKDFPLMKQLAGSDSQNAVRDTLLAHHPLALSMFNSIMSSNRAVLIKIPQEQCISFMKCRHQFRLIMQNPEREEKFQQLKAKHGARFCFHGSHPGNWWSILSNGLKNASGSKLQTHGSAHGAGIYLATYSGLSASYSEMYERYGEDEGKLQMMRDKHFNEEYIEPGIYNDDDDEDTSMRLISICECINHEVKESGDIWVQPHEEYVVARFLFVYTYGTAAPEEAYLHNGDSAEDCKKAPPSKQIQISQINIHRITKNCKMCCKPRLDIYDYFSTVLLFLPSLVLSLYQQQLT